MEAIKCKELDFTYPKVNTPAIKDLTLSVEKGELCLLVGESAVGKSTLLKLLKKEISPNGTMTGDIEIDGTVGYVAQNVDESIVSDKVRSELSFGLTNMGMTGGQIELLVAETASYFNLESKLDMDISSLSGGEKQMVNLASVMIMKPDILLLDEPTSQLDPVFATRFIQMIVRLHNDFGTTILMSEHNLDELISSATSIAFMQKGQPVVKDSVDKMADIISDSPIAELLPVKWRIKSLDDMMIKPYDDATMPSVAMEIKNVSFAYNRGDDVLSSLSLKVYEGSINAILGPNSSGKSTLLKVASGVKHQYRGKVKSAGKVSYLCQNVTDLFTKEKCSDEVEFGDLTDYLEISDIADQHPYDLSGGQAMRLALAKVLSTGADIILLDEPTKGLDPVLKKKLAVLLKDLCRKGKTVLVVSHDIEFVGEYADYASFLSRGEIITTSPRREFFSSLSFYTTQLARMTGGKAVALCDLGDRV